MSASTDKLGELRIDRSESDDKGSRALVWAFLALIVLAVGAASWWWSKPAAAEVVTALAREAVSNEASTVLNASGYVTARRQATVSSKITAKIEEVLIEEGMQVKGGQVLARLDASNARASLRLAQARVRAAETGLEEIRVMIAEAGLELDRADALVRDEVMSQAELDRVQARMDTLKARLDRQQEEAVVAEREVALWEQQIDDTIIRAPFDGVVTTKDAQPGEMISPISGGGQFTRTGIGTVVDMSSLEIEVDVNESYINRVEAGQSVVATLDAYPDWEIPCRVIAIVPTADRERATVRVRIGFMELDERVLPDMGVKVSFQSEELGSSRGPAVLVPKDAIRQDGDQSIVYLVDGESRAERRAVRTAEIEGDDVRILAGVSPGERVIVQGPREIQEGDLVRESVQ